MQEVTSSCLGLQAQFSSNPYYSLSIRSRDYDPEQIIRDYVKTWSFRGTMHLLHKDSLSLHLSARNRREWDDHWNMSAVEKPYWASFILNEVHSGNASRDGLKQACIKAGISDEHFASVFHGWGGLLQELCLQGYIAYDASTKKRFVPIGPVDFVDVVTARTEVIRQYFVNYGPATLADCAYFTGYKRYEIDQLIQGGRLALSSIECNSQLYFYLGELPENTKIPEIVILSGFDPLFLGYRDKSRFMDASLQRLYVTNTGIVFPAVLIRGHLAARWQKKAKRIMITLYKPIGSHTIEQVRRRFALLFPACEIQIHNKNE